jgi:hypothetical protein
MGYNDEREETLSPGYAEQLQTLRRCFRALVGLSAGEYETLLPRLVAGPPPSVPPRRRALSASLCAPR